ncbi:hypothetical protein [Bdellovibrio bacteriovorus]|uniref:hypothetical protein n=1 Tax=Bdellovibrio TaxID=958 RepID=UPI0035A973AC
MKRSAVLVTILGLLGSFCAHALTSTNVLPEGINSPSFRFGMIDGIDQKYTENGTLMNLGDYKSVVFDAPHLAKFNQDAKKLIDALNRFGGHNLGDNFNLGVLRVETTPKVKYFAPVFARGVTAKWTVGVGLPVVSYENQISLSQQFSNIEYYRAQFSGLSPELDEALNTNLGHATNQTLQQKGYKALNNRSETFLGDVQVASVYKFFEDKSQALIYQAQVSVPTGPQYDPDDLAALNIFGRTNVNNTVAYSKRVTSRISVVPYLSYLLNIPDQITARVPTNEDDTLPDANTKEDVTRQVGNTTSIGGNLFYEVSDTWTVGGGYEYSLKNEDSYSGSKNSRYDLLALNTDMKAQRVKAEVSYSSVKSYFKKTALIPMIVSIEVSDVIAGLNVERQLVQELNLMMFF